MSDAWSLALGALGLLLAVRRLVRLPTDRLFGWVRPAPWAVCVFLVAVLGTAFVTAVAVAELAPGGQEPWVAGQVLSAAGIVVALAFGTWMSVLAYRRRAAMVRGEGMCPEHRSDGTGTG